MEYDELFLLNATEACKQVDNFLLTSGIQTLVLPDHLCYKCANHGEFLGMRELLEEQGVYLYESWISGRLIAIIKLREPIKTSFGTISFIELQDTKEGSQVTSGFTHIECYPNGASYEAILSLLSEKGVQIVSDPTPHHPIHEVALSDSFVFRLEHEPVIEKIKREEL